MIDKPTELIQKKISGQIDPHLICYLPIKWEKIGDVLILVLSKKFEKYKSIIGETYAEVLNCKTVLNNLGEIYGVFRTPKVEIIYGSENTETIHKENKIRYKLDVAKIMFSSGNMNERIRMATISNVNEIVIDMFAGIGYFTLPLAVYSNPKKIFSCEINPISFSYLCENIVLNDVTKTVIPLLGNNIKTAPENIADRIIMGYLKNTKKFFEKAINCLKNGVGNIHYHETCPDKSIPNNILKNVKKIVEKKYRKVSLLDYKIIKSYAPGISHIVLDLKIDEK